jgi:DNA processing protein
MLDNKQIILALHHQKGIGPRTIQKLLHYWPNLNDLLIELNHEKLRVPLPAILVQALKALNWQAVKNDLLWSEGNHHHLLTWFDEDYPYLLRQIPSPPPVLYLKGQINVLKNTLLSVVGTRKPSFYGKIITSKWSEQLSRAGITLVSGLAIGVDTLVHEACVLQSRPTIAVLGNGLNRIYPLRNQNLGQKIIENGLLLSEFPLNFLPKAGHFPQRNRIISGLSLSTLITEATEKSGTMITAWHALEQNREVLVVPGQVVSEQSKGCHRLIQQGARLVMSFEEVLQCVRC